MGTEKSDLGSTNGYANGKAVIANKVSAIKKQPGIVELVIGVGGIYASLYEPYSNHPLEKHT